MAISPTTDPRLEEHFIDLTTGSLDGKGLFDHLMRTVHAHLLEEYDSQRIRGTDWTKVYLGSMEATLGNAVQYILGVSLTTAQLERLAAETSQITAQIAQTEAQTNLINKQAATEQLQADLISANIALVTAQKNEVDYRLANILPKEAELLDQNINKAATENTLIQAKTASETKNLSVLDNQITLLAEQASQYLRESNIKKAKIVSDAWSAKAVADGTGAGGPAVYSDGGFLTY